MFARNKLFNVIANNLNTKNRKYSITKVLHLKTAGEKVTLKGWIKAIRKMKECIFIDISDGTCADKLQVVVNKNLKQQLTQGASVSVKGDLNITPKGQCELIASDIEILGECHISDGYPFAPKKTYAPEYVRQYLHFRPRTNKFASLLRIRDAAMLAIQEYLRANGFISINAPILTSNDCEGAGEVFTVQPDDKSVLNQMIKDGVPVEAAYFDNKVFLSVSAQLHLEAVVHGISKVYSLGPTFRAENSRSRLHLSEFYMLECEMAFIDDLEQLAMQIEGLLKSVIINIMKNSRKDLMAAIERDVDFSWTEKEFPIITYDEAVAMLLQNNPEYKLQKGGFTKDDEMLIVKCCGDIPTFVINWPKSDKPFYMRECKDDNSKVAALDLLAPNVGEIVGGSLREDNYDKLKDKLPSDNLDWYLELRKFGGVPTAGFGMGFERYLQFILGINNIKDTIPFPRWPHNCRL